MREPFSHCLKDLNSQLLVSATGIITETCTSLHCQGRNSLPCSLISTSSTAAIMNAISAARHLESFFRQSSKAMAALCTAQENQAQTSSDFTTNLLLDVLTRWNSTYEMIKRLCQLQWVVRKVISDRLTQGRASHLELQAISGSSCNN